MNELQPCFARTRSRALRRISADPRRYARVAVFVPLFAWLLSTTGCTSTRTVPATEVLVSVNSDLTPQELRKIRMDVYEEYAVEPVSTHEFELDWDALMSGASPLPFSFGIQQGTVGRLFLVATGYGQNGFDGPIVEFKRIVNFEPRKSLLLTIFLSRGCLGVKCPDESTTCSPSNHAFDAAGSCTTIEDGPLRMIKPGDDSTAWTHLFEADGGTPQYALGTIGAPCAESLEGSSGCNGHGSTLSLLCERGRWREREVCDESERCNSEIGPMQGGCLPIVPLCAGLKAGDICDGAARKTCSPDLVSIRDHPCREHSHCVDDQAEGVSCSCDLGYREEGSVCNNVDNCSESVCAHGGRCVDGIDSYSCECSGTGYEGVSCANDIQECNLLPDACSEPYLCVQTEPPGYTCLGQYADWPMPDNTEGARVGLSYQPVGENIVLDANTGLYWEKTLRVDENCQGQSLIKGDRCSFDEAKVRCDRLVLGAYDDFRLPSKVELESILDETRAQPAIHPDLSGAGGAYWSSSVSPAEGNPWFVDFSYGQSSTTTKTAYMSVRCVRGGRPSAGTPDKHFLPNESTDTVMDVRTGLEWQRSETSPMAWGAAVEHCNSMNNGFRLPALKELLTLVDPTCAAGVTGCSAGAMHSAFLAGGSRNWSISRFVGAEPDAPPFAWLVNFAAGGSVIADLDNTASVRCVRSLP